MSYDYITRLQEEMALRKREIGPEDMAVEFAKLPARTRELHLLNLNKDAMTLRQGALRHRFESAIRKADSKLRSVGR